MRELNDLEDFVEQLKISIDSRIKIEELKLAKLILPYIPDTTVNHKTDCEGLTDNSINNVPTFSSKKLYNEQLFNMIEKFSHKICKLKYMLTKVDINNVLKTNKLIETEEYLNWDKKQMRLFFNEISLPNKKQ